MKEQVEYLRRLIGKGCKNRQLAPIGRRPVEVIDRLLGMRMISLCRYLLSEMKTYGGINDNRIKIAKIGWLVTHVNLEFCAIRMDYVENTERDSSPGCPSDFRENRRVTINALISVVWNRPVASS